jgi:uroporphyrinogen-III synthase
LRQSRNRGQDEQSAKQKRWSEIMADRLNGYRILILETREEAQFSRLLTEQGADVMQCPMFTIHDAPDPAPVERWIVRAIEKPLDDMVLLTGEGLRRLMKVVRPMGVEAPFIAALGKARKFARGPKPGKALREIGLEPQMTTEKPRSRRPSPRPAALPGQGSRRADRRHRGAGRRGRYRAALYL